MGNRRANNSWHEKLLQWLSRMGRQRKSQRLEGTTFEPLAVCFQKGSIVTHDTRSDPASQVPVPGTVSEDPGTFSGVSGTFSGNRNGHHGQIDGAEVHKALQGLLSPDQRHEIRALGPRQGQARSRLTWRNDPDALKTITTLADANGIYFTLNPVRQDLGDQAASASDVIERRNLLIDIDPVKAIRDGMATDPEKANAWDLGGRVRDHLENLGWPDPVVIDSGNGMHLEYLIDMPNDEPSKTLIGAVLKELAREFDNSFATVDIKVHDASRIAKLPGTWARKGPDTLDRPHRMARLISMPEPRGVVPRDRLEAVLPPPPPPMGGHWRMTARGDLSGYVAKAVKGEIDSLRSAGNRNNALNTAAFNLGQLEGWPEFDGAAVRAELRQAAIDIGLEADPNCGLSGIDKTINSGWVAGRAQPRTRPDPRSEKNGQVTVGTGESNPGEKARIAPVVISYVGSKELSQPIAPPEWLIKGLVVAGLPLVVAGPMKTLKTSILVDMTVSLGTGTMFLGRFGVPKPRRVALFSGESGRFIIRQNAKEIAENRGLYLENDENIIWGFDLPNLTDDRWLTALEKMIRDTGREVVAIDPLYLAMMSDQLEVSNMFSMGPFLDRFGKMCLEAGCLPMLCHHFKKTREDWFAPPELHELAYGGVSQWMGQWCLVSRREPYDASGTHKLHWRHGGRFGHSSELALDIETGVINDDFTGRKWNVKVVTPGQRIAAEEEQKQAEAVERNRVKSENKEAAKEEETRKRMEKAMKLILLQPDKALTKQHLRNLTGWNGDDASHVVTRLEQDGLVRGVEATCAVGNGAKRPCVKYLAIQETERLTSGVTG